MPPAPTGPYDQPERGEEPPASRRRGSAHPPRPTSRYGSTLVGCAGPVAVVAAVLLTNLPGLVGIVHPDPLDVVGMMSTHVSTIVPGSWFTDAQTGWTAQPFGHLAALDWLHGHVPWWNPYEGIGSPLAAEIQAAALFPPVLLFALPSGSLLFHVSLELAAGLATWFLLREMGLSRAVATVGGILFGLNGTFAWMPHEPMNPVPLLPLLLLGIERSYRQPERDSGWVIVACALALSILAGFPETAYLDGLLAAAWAILRILQASGGARVRLAVRLAGGGIVGLALALPLLVPVAAYVPHTFVGGRGAVGFGNMHLGPLDSPLFGMPYIYGPIGSFRAGGSVATDYWGSVGGFVTASSLALAAVGVLGSRRDRGLRVMLTAATGVVVAWTFGVRPFSYLTSVLPYMSHVWVERYVPPVWELGIILLACYGLDALGRDGRARLSSGVAGVLAIASGVAMVAAKAGGVAGAIARVDAAAHGFFLATVIWAGAMVVLVAVLGALGRRNWTVGAVAGLLLLDAVVMAGLPELSAPRSVTLDEAPIAYLRSHLGLGRYFTFGVYHSDYGSYFGIAQLDDTDLPVPEAWATEIRSQLAPNSNPVHFDGVQVASSVGPSPAAQVLSHLQAYEALDVKYLVAPSSPPIFGRGPVYPDGLELVFRDDFATVFALPHPRPYFSTSGPGCVLTPSGRNAVLADCRAPTVLVRSELDLAGWSATINGHSVPVLGYEGLLTSVRLPAGKSTVEFRYAPPHIDLALAGFLLGAVLLVGIPTTNRRRRRGGERPGNEPLERADLPAVDRLGDLEPDDPIPPRSVAREGGLEPGAP